MPEADWWNNEPIADDPREIREARFCLPCDLVLSTGLAITAIMANNSDWERVQVMGYDIIVPLALGLASASGFLNAARQGIMLRNYGNFIAKKKATV